MTMGTAVCTLCWRCSFVLPFRLDRPSIIYMKLISTQSLTLKVTSLGSDIYFSQVELVTATYASQDPEHIVYEHPEHISALL